MGTIAFKSLICFYEAPNSYNPQAELHLNIWESSNKHALDIGIKFKYAKDLKTIKFILPWKTNKEDIIDLSEKICIPDGLQAVFNESYSYTHKDKHYSIKNETALKESFSFFSIDPDDNLSIETHEIGKNNYSVLQIDIEKLLKNITSTIEFVYIRFRIKNIPKEFYQEVIKRKDGWLNSAIISQQVIEMRVNVKRDIPVKISNHSQYNTMTLINFDKIHLFLMKPKDDQVTFSDDSFKACRSLENETYWVKYAELKLKDVKNCLGYQWTYKPKEKPAKSEGWTVMAKFEKTKFAILLYLTIVLLVGITGGVLGNMIWNWISTKPSSEQTTSDTQSPKTQKMPNLKDKELRRENDH